MAFHGYPDLYLCVYLFSALLVMTIGLHYLSSRTSIMIGGVLIATANVINALSTNIGILFASFGVLEGRTFKRLHTNEA